MNIKLRLKSIMKLRIQQWIRIKQVTKMIDEKYLKKIIKYHRFNFHRRFARASRILPLIGFCE